MTASPVDWYAARTAGIVAYLLLTGVVLVGLTLSGQLRLARWPRFAVTDVHRFGGLLVGVFVSIHVATIAIDRFTPFSLTQLVVPLTARYRPVWTAVGIVAAELLIALAVTNLLRARIPYRWWRRLHVLNVAVWAAATVHGIGAGTDTRSGWMVALYAVSVSGVLGALAWRVARRRLAPSSLRGLAGAAGLLGVAGVLVLAATPHARVAPAAAPLPTAFTDSFSGSLVQQNGAAGGLLSILGSGGTGAHRVLVRVDLVTFDGQTISNTALQVKDLASGSVCSGSLTSLDGSGFSGSCSYAGTNPRSVSGVWRIAGNRVTGSLTVQA